MFRYEQYNEEKEFKDGVFIVRPIQNYYNNLTEHGRVEKIFLSLNSPKMNSYLEFLNEHLRLISSLNEESL